MKKLSVLSMPLVLLFGASAHANDPAAAEALFRDGRALADSGNYAEACAKLEESERLDPGIGTLYHLADCHEHLGRVATAWAELIDVAAQAKAHGQKDREQAARKRADALAPRLPHIVLEGAPPRGAELLRDATVVGAAELGTSIPVDPGSHKITVRSPGHVAWETVVTLHDGATVRVKLPSALAPAPVAIVAPAPAAPPVAMAAPPPAPATVAQPELNSSISTEPSHVQRNAGFVVAGAGLASIGVGTYFGICSIDNRNESRGHCTGSLCDARGVSLRGDALSAGNVSTVTFIAGAAALVGGGLLFFTAPSSRESHAAAAASMPPGLRVTSASPYAGPTGGGLSFTGEFR